jgi:hypothetical protein
MPDTSTRTAVEGISECCLFRLRRDPDAGDLRAIE